MRREKPKGHTVVDMYKAWCKTHLEKHPGHKDSYDHLLRMPGIRVIYNDKNEVYMTYAMFRCIIETHNKLASEAITAGSRFEFGWRLGILTPVRVERNFNNPSINIRATREARKLDPNAYSIYWTDDEYVSVKWTRCGRIKNESVYRFVPAKHSFKKEFSRANIENPILRTMYKFVPFIKEK